MGVFLFSVAASILVSRPGIHVLGNKHSVSGSNSHQVSPSLVTQGTYHVAPTQKWVTHLTFSQPSVSCRGETLSMMKPQAESDSLVTTLVALCGKEKDGNRVK